jgi:hypothetical protein
MTGESVPAQSLLMAEDVHRGGLLPERSLCMHYSRLSRWESYALDQAESITGDVAHSCGLAGRAGTKLEHNGRRDITRAGCGRFIVDE